MLQSREARLQTSAAAIPPLVDQAKRAALGCSAPLAPQVALEAPLEAAQEAQGGPPLRPPLRRRLAVSLLSFR